MKIIPCSLLALIAALQAPGYGETPAIPASITRYEQVLLRRPEPGPAFDRVVQYFQTGPGSEALEERWTTGFNNATDDKQKAGWATLAGILAQQQGETEAASEWFKKALDADPQQVKTRIALGELLANSGQFSAAMTVLEAGLDPERIADPDQGELYRQLALTQERDFQTEAAIKTWKILAGQPDADTFTLEETAEALARNQDYESAQQIFQKLAELTEDDPYQNVRFQIRLARLKEANGQYDEALIIYREAMPRTSGTSWLQKELRSRIEQVYRKQEDLPGLAEYYANQIESRGPDSETALLLAQVLDELGRDEEGTEWIRKAAEWSPSRTDLTLLLADRYLEEENPDLAITVLQPLAKADPSNKQIAVKMGDAYWERFEIEDKAEDRALALAQWNQIAPADSARASDVMTLAEILRRHDLAEESLDAYARAAALDPDSIDIREQWADWLFVLEQPEEAWSVLSAIVANEEQQTADRYLRLAQLRKRYGDRPSALEAIEQGLALDPESFDLLSLQWSVLAEEELWEEAVSLYPGLSASAPNDFFRRSVDQRHIQALAAADHLESTGNQLKSELGKDSLSENNIGLLLQIAVATRDSETAQLTIEEIQQRFSNSIPLYETSLSYYYDMGKYEEAITALSDLITLEPKRTDEWLQRKAVVQLEARQFDEAVATAEERVALNPTKVEAQLFLAEMYQNDGRTEKAIETLETGIRIAEDPSPIRQQLIDYLSAFGQTEAAYQQAWRLFEEAETLPARLATVPQLSNLALQNGKLNELIRDFERKRLSEENGYRYALFLASIYESAGDFAAARENLIEALAARPRDVVLIQQIMAMAKSENDWEDYVRFSGELAEIEPSSDNIFTHLEALLMANRADEALDWLSSHQDIFLRDIDSLRTMIASRSESADEVLRLFGRSLRQKGGDPKAQLALGEILLSTRDFEGAEEAFWRILQTDEPDTVQPASPVSSNMRSPMHFMQGALNTRLSYSQRARQESIQKILSDTNRQHGRVSYSSQISPTFEQIQDTALIYLAALAVRENRADSFLSKLEEILDRRADPVREKMIAFALLNESERAQAAAESLLASDNLSRPHLEEIQSVLLRNAFPRGAQGDSESVDQALAILDTLQEKWMEIDPQQSDSIDMFRLTLLSSNGRVEEAKALAQEMGKNLDPKSPQDFQRGFYVIHFTRDFDLLSKWIREYTANPQLQNSFGHQSNQMILGLIFAPVFQHRVPQGSEPIDLEESVGVTLENLRILWTETPAKPTLAGSQPNYGNHGESPTTFPGENSWIGNYELHLLQRLAAILTTSPEASNRLSEGLREIAGELEGDRRIRPLMTLAIWQQYQNEFEETAQIALALAEEFPQYPALRLPAARALLATEDYEAALEQLKQARVQSFAEKQARTLIELKALVELERKEEAETLAGEFFARTRASRMDYRIRNFLQQLDLNQAATRQTAAAATPNSLSASLRSGDWNQINTVLERMNQLEREGNAEEAQRIAEMILSSDPARNNRQNEPYLRDRALDIFIKDDEGRTLRESLEQQLEAAPNSAFLHYRLAELSLKAKSQNKSHAPFEPHLEKILALRPDDTSSQARLANLLAQAREYGAAADLYSNILSRSPTEALNNSHNLVRAYVEADRVEDLIQIAKDPEIIRKVTAANQWALSNFLQQIAHQLENDDRREAALEIRTVGLRYLDWNNRLNQIDPILDLQIELGRIEEARETLWNAIFAEEGMENGTPEARFGFGPTNSRHSNLFSNISYRNANFTIRGVQILDRVDQLGLNERVLAWLAEEDGGWLNDNDQFIANTFIRLNQRDLALLDEIESDEFITGLQSGMMFHRAPLLLTLAQRLAAWDDAREAAFKIYQTAITSPTSGHHNSYEQQIRIRAAIALTELASSEEEVQEANQILESTLASTYRSLLSSGNNPISKEIAVELLATAIQNDQLSEESLEDWLRQIRSQSNWGDSAEAVASYVEILAGGNRSEPLYPAIVDNESVRVMTIAPEGIQRGNRSKVVTFDGSSLDLTAPPILHVTPSPRTKPVALPTDAPLTDALASTLPDGFGYLFLGREEDRPESAPRDLWTPISILPNLLSQPNPAEAPLVADSEFLREGWQKLPSKPIESVSLTEYAPIGSGNRVVHENNHERQPLLSEKIPIESQHDLLLSGWFGGLDSMGEEGYVSFGLVFLDENDKQVRTSNEWTRIPFDDLWAPISVLSTADGSSRQGRFSYPKSARFVQVRLEIDPGVIFGGLHLSAIPPSTSGSIVDAYQLMSDAVKAARDKKSEEAADLFLTALRGNPARAVSRWPNNQTYWREALESSGRLEEIFAFLSQPEIYDDSSFRYYRQNVTARGDLFEAAELAIQNPEIPSAEIFLKAVIQGQTCLDEKQINQLMLQWRATGAEPASPEENLELGLKVLGLIPNENDSNRPRESEWETALQNLEHLDLFGTLLETLQGPDSLHPPESVDSLLIQSWILAIDNPEAAGEILQGIAENRAALSKDDQKLAALVLGRMASTTGGVDPALMALKSLSDSTEDDAAKRARFRYEALDQFAKGQANPSPELLDSLREAEIEWIEADPENSLSRIRRILGESLAQQDFVTVRRILEASEQTGHHANTVRQFSHVFPRLTTPDRDKLWPVALAGPVGEEGARRILIRFHPNNDIGMDETTDQTPNLTLLPVLETVSGLERVELRFGGFPLELKTITELSGEQASREIRIELPEANGFLQAVAYVEGKKVPGPITPVFSASTMLWDPENNPAPDTISSFTAFPPELEETISITKSKNLDPDVSGIEFQEQDILLFSWATTTRSNSSIAVYPRYPGYDYRAAYRNDIRTGEFTFSSTWVPGISVKEDEATLAELDLRLSEGLEMSPIQFMQINREQSEYLLWMAEVREAAVRIAQEEEIPATELLALAQRDPYGSAPYLLHEIIETSEGPEGNARALNYLRSIDSSVASPFHQNSHFSSDVRYALTRSVRNPDLTDDLRWESALALYRVPDLDTIYILSYLSEAAADDPVHRDVVRERTISWINGEGLSEDVANSLLKREFKNDHTARGVPRNLLNNALKFDYDEEVDEILRKRLAEVDIDLEEDPGKSFVLATLLADPSQMEEMSQQLVELLSSSDNDHSKGMDIVFGVQNLKERGFPAEDRQALLLEACEILRERDPLHEAYDPPAGLIMVTGEILRNEPTPPVEPMVETAQWITRATQNPKSGKYFLSSDSLFLLIDFLGNADQDEVKRSLLTALREKLEGYSRLKVLNERFPPQTESP